MSLKRSEQLRELYESLLTVETNTQTKRPSAALIFLKIFLILNGFTWFLCPSSSISTKAMLYWPMPNVLYVEGYALDKFAQGLWSFHPVHGNKIGLVSDGGIEEHLLMWHLQVADVARASLGLPVLEYIVTDKPLQVFPFLSVAFFL